MSARSIVQDSGAPAWLSTAARDLGLIASLAKLAQRGSRVEPAYFVVASRR